MAKFKVVGDAAVLISDISVETLEKLETFRPEALQLLDEDKEPIFAIATGPHGHMGSFGVCFDSKTPTNKAQLTLNLPVNMTNAEKKEYIKTKFGLALLKLNKLEANIQADAASLAADFDSVERSIEI
jgi:hypothetical protein